MRKRIFRGIFGVSMLVLVAALVLVIGVVYPIYSQNQRSQIRNTASIIADSYTSYGKEYLQSIPQSEIRITLISAEGEVLYDSELDYQKLNNHIDREEVKGALENGSGEAVRFSDTLSQDTYYYALRVENGEILRVSALHTSLLPVILQLASPIAAVMVLTMIMALVLASVIAKNVVKPINEINLDSPVESEDYEELAPLMRRLKVQNKKIQSQINELTARRREFGIISDNMNEGMLLVDIRGIVLAHNKSIERLFGVFSGIDGGEMLSICSLSEFKRAVAAAKSGERTAEIMNVEDRCLELRVNPVYDEENNHRGSVILVVDVTEKENNERIRKEFTANVSHELKTPLTSIYGISDMLASGIVKPEDVSGFANDICREAKRLIDLVQDIIKLSRLDEGFCNMEEDVELHNVSDEVVTALKEKAEKYGVSLSAECNSVSVKGNSSLVFEMLYNLCENAVKYNRKNGSVVIRSGSIPKPYITVSDTGIGIAAEDINRIFERFYRVDKSRSSDSGGTGLGLSIVKHIAACHNAEIDIKSEVGRGTDITVFF